MTYEQALEDRDYLFETYGPARDMTGGWVEGDYLEVLLQKPTKTEAKKILSGLVRYWFESGYERNSCDDISAPDMSDPILVEIADRHNPSYIKQQ